LDLQAQQGEVVKLIGGLHVASHGFFQAID
jgi:hypothetical protein